MISSGIGVKYMFVLYMQDWIKWSNAQYVLYADEGIHMVTIVMQDIKDGDICLVLLNMP